MVEIGRQVHHSRGIELDRQFPQRLTFEGVSMKRKDESERLDQTVTAKICLRSIYVGAGFTAAPRNMREQNETALFRLPLPRLSYSRRQVILK